jgi:hypothetical protein
MTKGLHLGASFCEKTQSLMQIEWISTNNLREAYIMKYSKD